MAKTRKQRAGGKHHPSLPSLKKPSRFLGTVHSRGPVMVAPVNENMTTMRGAKPSKGQKKKSKKSARKSMIKTLNIKPTTSVKTYIREVTTILYKINEILRNPEDGDYDLALETAGELGKKLNRLERDLGADEAVLNHEDSYVYNEIVERYIELIGEFDEPAERVLIASTVDEVLNEKRRTLFKGNSNDEMGVLVAMLGAMGPFRS